MKKRTFTRRDFMTTLAAGTGTVLLGRSVFEVPELSSTVNTDPFQLITLGNTGIKTTLLGMGTGVNAINGSAAIIRAGADAAHAVIRKAYEKGIRNFDCADSYGTHPYVRDALKGFPRESYTLTTKIWLGQGGIPGTERPDANIVIDRFRKELATDYLDLVQIHYQTSGRWTETHKRQMDILDDLKAKKIIRAHGVSIHSSEAMEAAIASPWVDVVHVRINPFGEAMDQKDPAIVVSQIEKLHKSGKGVIGMKLIGNGAFKNDSEKIDASVRFVLGLGTVDMIVVGFETPDQIDNYTERVIKALKTKS
jgi:aryl-alcohol dehydrogenase-like predicted oxidoreductase